MEEQVCACSFFFHKNKSTMKLNTGDPAPKFKLFNTEKKEISLDDFQNKKVLLLFFPFAFTGTCTKELCGMRDDIGSYSNLDVEVLGISVDSLFTLAKYKTEQQLNFHLLSDFNKRVSEAYGSLYEKFIFGTEGVSKRSAFLIDGKGIIRYAEVLEEASEIPNFMKIKECLAEMN
jgi:peroxiredoxin